MKLKLQVLFIFIILIASACSPNPPSGSLPAPYPDYPDGPSPVPYPDTPSPARVAAPRVESPSLLALDMFNELDGWGVNETKIVRTNDGGIGWYDVTPPGMQETGYSVDTFFLDRDHAWVQKQDPEKFPNGGTLFRTTDGGLTWLDSSVPFSRGDLKFVDAENGWMMADQGVAAGSNAVAVYQTTDGGASWQKTYTNDPNDPDAKDSLPLGGIKSDLVPLDMNSAWVTGVVYAPGEVYLYRTVDQGKSWVQVTLPLPPGTQEFDFGIDEDQLKFVSATDGYLAVHLSGEAMQTAVYVTHDAGNTWNLSPTLIDGAGASSFLTGQEAVLYNGTVFNVTRDGARSWVSVTPDVSFGQTFVTMEFVNTMSGWVITMDPSNHRSLYRTLDGGSTWLPVVP